MSVNLHLGVVVRDYRPDRTEAIARAVREVLVREEIDEDLPPLTESVDSSGRRLASRSNLDRPVIITGAYEWAMRIEKELREAASQANGEPCRVEFQWDDADEGQDEPDEDEG